MLSVKDARSFVQLWTTRVPLSNRIRGSRGHWLGLMLEIGMLKGRIS
jgi:hypothetical protein